MLEKAVRDACEDEDVAPLDRAAAAWFSSGIKDAMDERVVPALEEAMAEAFGDVLASQQPLEASAVVARAAVLECSRAASAERVPTERSGLLLVGSGGVCVPLQFEDCERVQRLASLSGIRAAPTNSVCARCWIAGGGHAALAGMPTSRVLPGHPFCRRHVLACKDYYCGLLTMLQTTHNPLFSEAFEVHPTTNAAWARIRRQAAQAHCGGRTRAVTFACRDGSVRAEGLNLIVVADEDGGAAAAVVAVVHGACVGSGLSHVLVLGESEADRRIANGDWWPVCSSSVSAQPNP